MRSSCSVHVYMHIHVYTTGNRYTAVILETATQTKLVYCIMGKQSPLDFDIDAAQLPEKGWIFIITFLNRQGMRT